MDPTKFNLDNYHNDSLKGCVLEDDVEYPIKIYTLHNDYQLAPVKLKNKKRDVAGVSTKN